MHTHILDFSVYLYLTQYMQHNTQSTPLNNMSIEASLNKPTDFPKTRPEPAFGEA